MRGKKGPIRGMKGKSLKKGEKGRKREKEREKKGD